jgi:F0F1-type ATP synthase assembly protein I
VSADSRDSGPRGPFRRSDAWGKALRESAPYIGIGWTLAVTVLLGVGVGYWLDQRLGTDPWLVLAGALLGMIVAFYHFFKTVARLGK